MNTIAHTHATGTPATPVYDRDRSMHQIDRLFRDLEGRDLPQRTAKLMSATRQKKARKLVEEAAEVTIDAIGGDCQGVIIESADLLYHLVVLWHDLGIDPHEVWTEMAHRSWTYGIAQKRAKGGGDQPTEGPCIRRHRAREFGPVYLRPSRGATGSTKSAT
jgi:phosphoribosyl-ATP pyrophosphohydrolase